ncbi:uncharacterized protein LOC119657300 [Hermetia illucens]|uniref:uncharacterized protein LOC119657300 n=1 Tax=Hermetia illucens TaxID=343691 RepID=UPI0018CC67F3|nr:uncharacterized protein LOC119657300 [Hermetia illucens]
MVMQKFSMVLIALTLVFITNNIGFALKRSCGSLLTSRLYKVCQDLGGYNVFRDDGHPRRQRRSIVEECCRNACSDKDVSQYCRIKSTKEDFSEEIPEPVPNEIPKITSTTEPYQIKKVIDITEITSDYPPILFGTVSPEYTGNSMSPQISKYYDYQPFEDHTQ